MYSNETVIMYHISPRYGLKLNANVLPNTKCRERKYDEQVVL